MATFKHISSKNADYGAAEQYLTFEHDEFTMKPTLDENGRLIPRDDYRISSLNCGGEDFAIACMRSNLRYGKNQKREDVKSHHYIISFDPRDAQDNGLSVDRSQQLGEQFCKEHFPGHQALVCTHTDGHNHSGNIHVHIVINSLRIAEVPLLPYMERPADTREGYKHRCTDAAMEYFKAEVMEMCHRENLYQIDLLNGSKNRVTEREYWAKRKGQAALDKENASLAAAGEPPKVTKFETDKERLRNAIRTALSSAVSFEDFSGKLLQQGVTVKESRGRLSYLTPDRTKPITARKLGDDFDRAAVLEAFTLNAQNAARAAEKPLPKQEYPRSIKDRLQRGRAAINAPKQDSVQRMVDREPNRYDEVGLFSGILFCADCGSVMYQQRYQTDKRQQDCYICGSYKKRTADCTAHFIRTDLLTEGVTENLRKVTSYAAKHEARFMKLLTEQTEDGSKRRNAAKKKELEAAEKRIAELSAIFKRLYEDSVAGRISDERFTELSADYEAEQRELKEKAAVLQGELSRTLEATANAEKFMKVVRKYTSFEELTPTLLREFVEKIVIHESEALDGKRRGKLRRQEIEIYYSFVGKVELPD